MTYYTKYWKIVKDGEVVMSNFITKKSALAWIAEQTEPEGYSIVKVSML
jgi:hypothetical protein